MSYHNFTAGAWQRHMGWNDNHVSLELSQYVLTQYDNAAAIENDNAGRGDLIFNGDLANDLSPDSDALIAPVQIADGNP